MNSTLTSLEHQFDSRTGILNVTIPGDILSTNADALREELFALLESAPIQTVDWKILKLDLARAQMIDSVGLNLIVSIVRIVKARNGMVEAAVRSANIHRTFSFTRLDKQIRVIKIESPSAAETESATAASVL